MAKRIEVRDNFLVITDTITNVIDIQLPKSNIYAVILSSSRFNIRDLDTDDIVGDINGYSFTNVVDATGTAFGSFALLTTFLRKNTGSDSATSSEDAVILALTRVSTTRTGMFTIPQGFHSILITQVDGLKTGIISIDSIPYNATSFNFAEFDKFEGSSDIVCDFGTNTVWITDLR